MNKLFTKTLFIVICLISSGVAIAGGGWTLDKGSGYLKLGQSAIFAGSYYTPAGHIIDLPATFKYFSTSIYFEYGLSDKVDVMGYVPFLSRGVINQREFPDGTLIERGDDVTSFGDTDIGLKYGLIRNQPYVLSATLTFGLPIGNPKGGAGESIQTGDGEFNQMLTFDLSHSFGKYYYTLTTGFNNRTNNFSDEFRYGFEIGASVSKFFFITKILGVKPINNGNATVSEEGGFFSNRIEYLAITPEIAYQASNKIGFTASAGFAAYGKNVLASPNFSVGIYTKF